MLICGIVGLMQEKRLPGGSTTRKRCAGDPNSCSSMTSPTFSGLEIALARMNLNTVCADSLASARNLIEEQARPCLTDMRLPDGDELELVEQVQRLD